MHETLEGEIIIFIKSHYVTYIFLKKWVLINACKKELKDKFIFIYVYTLETKSTKKMINIFYETNNLGMLKFQMVNTAGKTQQKCTISIKNKNNEI